MKRILSALVAVLFLLGLAVVPHTTTYAAADATCSSDPSAGPVGTTFVITCWGYTPNSYVYAYLVEPTGVATLVYEGFGGIKVKEDGSITYTQPSSYPNVALQVGAWGFVAEELGLAKTVLHRGETTFTITGGTEGVSGASFSANPSTINKPEQAYLHYDFPGGYVSDVNFSDPVTLSGDNFTPGEVVTIWAEPAGGGCPTMTRHNSIHQGVIAPGIGGIYVKADINTPIYDGLGAQYYGDVKANQAGEIATQVSFTPYACEGNWRFVARGNTSGNGAETWITVIGNPVATNAWLTADPTSASAMFGTINFAGSGFGANEHVTCWLTTPQGRTIGYPEEYFVTFSGTTIFYRDQPILANAAGEVGFSFVSGNYYEKYKQTLIIGGVSQSDSDTNMVPANSEGALGEYAMSCRGDSTGNTAIARFTLTGGFVDP
ncbi:MAG: hypothetical protein BroJett039_12830 [Chloroflexota bacterium]|nr:MAG: hypothetical protein BroJett039_12830 [Chloroflexota bacterium]